jgi:hypothetical protein
MPSDLEMSLVNGGLAPALAKVISGAIDNAASSRYTRGRAYSDATPPERMRMITRDARRYVFTNLDYAADQTFRDSLGQQSSTYSPSGTGHPYQDSQPATSSGTLATPAVASGEYVDVSTAARDSVAQATVGLKISDFGGRHARFDKGNNAIQAVPFSVEVAQEQFIEARFEERKSGTVLKIALKNLKTFTLPDGTKLRGWAAQ